MSNFSYEAYQAKGAIAEAVVPILKEYKLLLLSDNSYSLPNWVIYGNETLTEYEMSERWLEYVELMITAFEMELKHSKTAEEISIQEKGLSLFAKYYIHLWD